MNRAQRPRDQEADASRPASQAISRSTSHLPGWFPAGCEWLLIVLLFYLHAGTTPPDVNEAHYLGKAKHYWDATWCAGDPFLESADAHWFFYWTFGWLTRFWSLTEVAWFGRFLTWGLLAWPLRRLCSVVVPGRFRALLVAGLFASLVRWGHLGGEWILGGVEAKGFAYSLLFFALDGLARGRWRVALVCSGAAAAWHVLVGGWGLVALAWAWGTTPAGERPRLTSLLPAAILAAVLTLPGVIPGVLLTWGQDPATVQEANRIYVFERLSHHLVFHRLPHVAMVRHALLIATFLGGWRALRRSESRDVPSGSPGALPGGSFAGAWPRWIAGAIVVAVAGAVLDQSLLYFRPLAASLLRYYWFRLSDVLTPLGVSLVLVEWQARQWRTRPGRGGWLLATLLSLVTVDAGYLVWEHRVDPRPESMIQAFRGEGLAADERVRRWREWLRMCAWIKEHTDPRDLFLTPRYQQSFKWDAERPEVVSGKDVPQDAAGVVAWRKRMDDIFPYTVRFADLAAHGESRLIELSEKYRFRYIVLDRGISTAPLRFRRVYPAAAAARSTYEVYQVAPGASDDRALRDDGN